MTVLRDVSDLVLVPEPPPELPGRFRMLVDEKAWEHLGVTGEEFRRGWYAGEYDNDQRDQVQALDRLMRTGYWS